MNEVKLKVAAEGKSVVFYDKDDNVLFKVHCPNEKGAQNKVDKILKAQ